MDKNTLPRATLGRLPTYLEFLTSLDPEVKVNISATSIAKALKLGEVQVRKDLNLLSGAGRPRVGYQTKGLIKSLEQALAGHGVSKAVLVGAGKLGKALLDFDEFKNYGIEIIAAFDLNDQIVSLGSVRELLPMDTFEDFCQQQVEIGIITVGQGSAQAVCDQMIACGIKAIWNFAPCKLKVPPGFLLQNENLALSLAHLKHQIIK